MSYPPPPAGGYGQPGQVPGPYEHPKGTTVLVLGILGLVCCAPLGIAAWVMGNNAIREIDASGAFYSNRGTVNAGRICGMIGTILWIVGIVLYAVLAVAVFSSGSMSS